MKVWWIVLVCLDALLHVSPSAELLDRRDSGHDTPLSPILDPNDPISSLQIVYPLEGSVERLPVAFAAKISVRPGSESLFADLYRDRKLCLEVNQLVITCYELGSSGLEFNDWEPGNYTLRVFITHKNSTHKRYRQSAATSFVLVGSTEFNSYLDRLLENERPRYRPGYDEPLTEWADVQKHTVEEAEVLGLHRDDSSLKPRSTQDGDGELILLIGVKTASMTNFPLRQAMRETWASAQALPPGVKLFFLGCRPFTSIPPGELGSAADTERRRQWEAVELEKRVYGDMLTDELDCDDSYLGLASKVKEFLHLAATRFAHAQYVMVADDDIYVRLDKVVKHLRDHAQRQHFYGGQILRMTPIRTEGNRNHLSKQQYPLTQLPPFALGEYFFVSMDCAQFVSKNRRRLRDLGGMDDISVPLWMLAMQVHPQRILGLEHLRATPCIGKSTVLGDLSPLAIRAIHANIAANRSFCHGFRRYAWLKPQRLAPPPGFAYLLPPIREALQIAISLGTIELISQLEVIAVVSTATRAGIKISCFPSNETFQSCSRRVCGQVRLLFPGAIGTTSCSEFSSRIQSELLRIPAPLPIVRWSDGVDHLTYEVQRDRS